LNVIVTLQAILVGALLFLLVRSKYIQLRKLPDDAPCELSAYPPSNSQLQTVSETDSRLQAHPVHDQPAVTDRATPSAYLFHLDAPVRESRDDLAHR